MGEHLLNDQLERALAHLGSDRGRRRRDRPGTGGRAAATSRSRAPIHRIAGPMRDRRGSGRADARKGTTVTTIRKNNAPIRAPPPTRTASFHSRAKGARTRVHTAFSTTIAGPKPNPSMRAKGDRDGSRRRQTTDVEMLADDLSAERASGGSVSAEVGSSSSQIDRRVTTRRAKRGAAAAGRRRYRLAGRSTGRGKPGRNASRTNRRRRRRNRARRRDFRRPSWFLSASRGPK